MCIPRTGSAGQFSLEKASFMALKSINSKKAPAARFCLLQRNGSKSISRESPSAIFWEVSHPNVLSRWLEHYVKRINAQTGLHGYEGPNHVLVNAYSKDVGIYDHQDGPIYHPAACILSTGAPAVINFRRKLLEGLDVYTSALLMCPRPSSLKTPPLLLPSARSLMTSNLHTGGVQDGTCYLPQIMNRKRIF